MRTFRITKEARWAWRLTALPLLGLVVGLLAAVIVTAILTPSYEAKADVLSLPVAAAGAPDITTIDIALAQSLVLSIAKLAESPEVAVTVAGALHVGVDEVSGHLSGSSIIGTQVVTITATADTADLAAAIVNAATEAVADLSAKLSLGGPRVSFKPLAAATPPSAPTTPRRGLNAALGAFVGLVLGVGALTLRTSLNDRFRKADDLESELGLPALAVVNRRSSLRPSETAAAVYGRPQVREAIDGLVSAIGILGTRHDGRRILVTSAGDDTSSNLVAALLAIGLAAPDRVITEIDARSDAHDDELGDRIDAASNDGHDVVVTAPSVMAGRGLAELACHADVVLMTVDSDRIHRAAGGRAAALVKCLDVATVGLVVTGWSVDQTGWQRSVWPGAIARQGDG